MDLKQLTTPVLLKLSSFVFWSNLYLWTSLQAPQQSPEWCSRVITLLHGTVATLVGTTQCEFKSLTRERVFTKVLPRHYALMLWSWGYFAFDLLWCIIYWRGKYVMLGHHAFALLGITLYMEKQNSGCTFACCLTLMEITNPLLQTRWFLKHEGHSKTVAFYVVEITYLILFIVIRGVVGTYVLGHIVLSNKFQLDEKIISMMLHVVNIVFLYDILCYGYHKYRAVFDKNHTPSLDKELMSSGGETTSNKEDKMSTTNSKKDCSRPSIRSRRVIEKRKSSVAIGVLEKQVVYGLRHIKLDTISGKVSFAPLT